MMDRVERVVRRVGREVKLQTGRVVGRPVAPPPGRVRFGDLRRTRPIATDFGYGRGGPVDRSYIERFLDRHATDIMGRCLEIGDASYLRQFGGDRLERVDVLHVDPNAPDVTLVGDLADEATLPPGVFDCVVLTQTLHLIFDFEAALRNVRRSLAPGGVLLMTVPGISHVDPGSWGSTWHYSFSRPAVERMMADCFAGCEVTIGSHGNVLAAIAFLHGLGVGELTAAELDDDDEVYSLIHTVRAVQR
jgi:SAM-dependent methyltransferase